LRRLLIRPGAIGDLIVSLPALEFLRADYTEVWTAEQNAPLIRFADRVRSIGATGLDLAELGRAPEQLWSELARFDSIVSWYGATRAEFREAVRALPFTFHAVLPFTSNPALPVLGARVHAVDFYLAQAGAPLGAMPSIPVTSISTPLTSAKRLAVIHPFSSGGAKKNWPLERFRSLARELASRDWEIAWTAGPEEPLDGATRFDDLHQLACWLAAASLYIGNDSGISHLAAAVGAPTMAIFGPASNPAVWAPRGQDVRVVETADLDLLPVARVLERVLIHP
jgi:ADP-heptose:LPS heptosyltransferase